MNTFPKIMGILNVTPDSFSDGGSFFDTNHAVKKGLSLIENGASILDIGGESTRPGAAEVSIEDEIARVVPVIKQIREECHATPISIDTTKYEVAKAALDAGANIINDISGLTFDERLADLAAEYNATLIIMHIQGQPRNMQNNPQYNDVVNNVLDWLKDKIDLARSKGVKDIIADVGIGFGKTFEHNITLLREHDRFLELEVPLLLGISRKSFIGQAMGIDQPIDRDIPTAFFHSVLLDKKIDIIRVHNVELHNSLKKIITILK